MTDTHFTLSFASEMIADHQIETGLLKPDLKDKVTYTLLRKHRHQTKKSNLRSLADIGKTVSSASRMFSNPDNGNAEPVAAASSLFLCHLTPSLHTPYPLYFFSQVHAPWSFHDPRSITGCMCNLVGRVSLLLQVTKPQCLDSLCGSMLMD